MTKIYLVASDQTLTATQQPKVAAGNKKSVTLHVDFSSHWNGYGKSAVFYTEKSKTPYECPLSDGECNVPVEVLANPGMVFIGVRGVNSDDNSVKVAALVRYKIVDGAPEGEGTTVEPTPNVYQQLLTAYGKTDAAIAKETADRKKAIASEVSERQAEIAVERKRIDSFVALKDGSTTGDAELQDIRIGISGNPYSVAGTAVREQIGNLVKTIDEICSGENINVFWRYANGGNKGKVYKNDTGELISTSGNYSHSGLIPVIPGQTVTIYEPEPDGKCITMMGAYFDVNKNVVRGIGMHPNYTSGESVEIIIPEGIFFIGVNYHLDFAEETAVIPHVNLPWMVSNSGQKVWCCVGDSLTEANNRAEKHYFDYIAEELGLSVLNYGVSGTGYKNGSFANRITNNITEDFDFMTIFGSFNDLDSTLALGEITDNDTSTLYGCMNLAIENFFTKYPTKKIAIITPTPWKVGINYFGVATTKENMEAYADALVNVARKHRIPYLDLYHCSGLNPDNQTVLSTYFNENGTQDAGAHPNSSGHKFIAQAIKEFIKTL